MGWGVRARGQAEKHKGKSTTPCRMLTFFEVSHRAWHYVRLNFATAKLGAGLFSTSDFFTPLFSKVNSGCLLFPTPLSHDYY